MNLDLHLRLNFDDEKESIRFHEFFKDNFVPLANELFIKNNFVAHIEHLMLKSTVKKQTKDVNEFVDAVFTLGKEID